MLFGDNIKKLRTNKNWTQKELAAKSGITRESIGNYERGDRIPAADTLKNIAIALGVNIDALVRAESFDFEILFESMDLMWNYSSSNNTDDLISLSKYANVDYETLNDFNIKKISHLPLDCIKGLLNFIVEKSPDKFNKIYNNLIATNIYDLDTELKNYCQQIYIKTMNTLDINDTVSMDSFLLFMSSEEYPTIKLNNKTLKYLHEKVTELLEFEFYKLEKNNFNLIDDKENDNKED